MQELIYRRVPQIVGMYVAATWLVIEIGDWVTERFSLPPSITSFVFITMLVLLPALILFAYNHGAPGQDKWTKTEKFFIPINIFVAVGILYFVSPELDVEAATQTVQIEDEAGIVQEYIVAREGHHKEVLGFFWKNNTGDTSLDWLSYGAAIMLAHDMNSVSPAITVDTPFGSRMVKRELISKDFSTLKDEPLSLQMQITRDRRSAALIVGSFSVSDGIQTLDTSVIDADSGNVIGAHTVTGDDWFAAIDDISAALLNYLEVKPAPNQSNDPIGQHLTGSLDALKHYINGQVALAIANDYPQGIAEFKSALALDSDFAEANRYLSRAQYLSGDIETAKVSVGDALANSYRLSEPAKFELKANRYLYEGNFERGERVLEMWTEVHPNSVEAYETLARIAKVRGGDEGLATASAAYDRLLELKPTDYGIFRDKAAVEQQRGDYAAAARYLSVFLEHVPDSSGAHIQLANIHQAQGDLDSAQEALEDAAILSDDPLSSELGLARLEARRGRFNQAERRMARQLRDDLPARQRMTVLSAQLELANVMGRMSEALRLIDEVDRVAAEFMPPMLRLVSIQNQKTGMLLMNGNPEAALELADEIVAQLQAPLDAYIGITYTSIFYETNDRQAFQERAEASLAARDQLPDFFQSFIEMNAATLSIWNEDFASAESQLDRANDILSQSMIQLMQSNLGVASMQVKLAELYLQAKATSKYRARIEDALKVFPADPYAKLVYAKGQIADGNLDSARASLESAIEIWSEADASYVRLVEAKELLSSI